MRKIYCIMAALTMLTMACGAQAQKKQSRPTKEPAKKDTLTIIQDRVKAGDAVAMNILGSWYYAGQHVAMDYKQAASWFTKAADKGNIEAIGNMAMCYQTGNGLKKDSAMAVKLYEKSIKEGNKALIKNHEQYAKNGSAFSSMLIHDVYSQGIGVAKDPQTALNYLKLASDANSTEAQVKYGLACMNSKNFNQAADVFAKLAKKNHPTGIYYTGYLLYKGLGVSQDKGKGLGYLKKAAGLNMPQANYYLGKAYLDGDGIEKDSKKAVEHLEKASASILIPDAKWLLGNCYLDGEGVKQDFANAAQWLALVAPHKDYTDKVNALLGEKRQANFNTYLKGMKNYLVNKNFEAAMKDFKALEKAKNPEGLAMEALCLLNADYAKHNDKKGLKMLETAAATSATAACKLAEIYDQGKLVEKDSKKALSLLEQAADKGNGKAVCLLGMKYFDGNGVPQDYAKAAKYLLRAEGMQSLTVEAAKKLSTCYKNKVSALPDLRNAEERIRELSNVKENDTLIRMLKAL
ncbi:MAG: sel1 repeat family protein [Prevotella sp.]|nr:sel1 repeat family protein [Prevotella sp.]